MKLRYSVFAEHTHDTSFPITGAASSLDDTPLIFPYSWPPPNPSRSSFRMYLRRANTLLRTKANNQLFRAEYLILFIVFLSSVLDPHSYPLLTLPRRWMSVSSKVYNFIINVPRSFTLDRRNVSPGRRDGRGWGVNMPNFTNSVESFPPSTPFWPSYQLRAHMIAYEIQIETTSTTRRTPYNLSR